MDALILQKYIIHLLSSVLCDAKPQSPPLDMDWEELFRQSFRHSIANMICYALERLDLEEQPALDVMDRFRKEQKKAIAKEAFTHIAVELILQRFEENKIVCMPLKGYLIKDLYPKPDMRLMADIDIYFQNEQTEKVREVMTELGYTLKHQGGNHDVYYRMPYMNIEMHRRLVSESSPYSGYLSKTWERGFRKPGCEYIYQLSLEDFYIYLLIHLTKHFCGGGTGIRSFMDIWVYRCCYREKMHWSYIKDELKKIGLSEFVEKVHGLIDIWFDNGQDHELYREMTAYIFSSGTYGTRQHSVISSLRDQREKTKRMPKFLFWMKKIFLPLELMKNAYPLLNKNPWLLPVCWVQRGFKCLLYKRKYFLYLIKHVRSLSEEDINQAESLHKKIGLKK